MKRAAFFVRVSKEDLHSANQVPDLKRFAKARGLELWKHYEETASRVATHRPELERMLSDAHQRRFDVLVVWALDRLGAGMSELLEVVRRLDVAGVRLLSVQENWVEVEGPTRDLMLGIMGWCAKQERARLIERTNAGLARARAQGKRLGRPSISINPHALELELVKGGTSRQIARRLGVSRSTLFRERARLGR